VTHSTASVVQAMIWRLTLNENPCQSMSNRFSVLKSGMFDLPMIRKLMLQSMVTTRMPASSVLMRSRRWISAVAHPAANPAATVSSTAATGFTWAVRRAAHMQPPSGKAPSHDRSGKLSSRKGTMIPKATSA
jgi:hypothetical protein